MSPTVTLSEQIATQIDIGPEATKALEELKDISRKKGDRKDRTALDFDDCALWCS